MHAYLSDGGVETVWEGVRGWERMGEDEIGRERVLEGRGSEKANEYERRVEPNMLHAYRMQQ